VPDAAAKPGLRERKKQRTRDAIVAHALALFEERGFDATTISDIAEAAEIAPRTFFGYFASKEDVVFHDAEEAFASFRAQLDTRADDQTAFDALRDWVVGHVTAGDFDNPKELRRRRLIDATPALRARERVNLSRFEELFAGAVGRDLGVPPESLRARLVSAAAVAALETLSRHAPDEPPADPMPVLDEALVFLGGGLEALRHHPSSAAQSRR
jgi:AcrR family transcriptional regulator